MFRTPLKRLLTLLFGLCLCAAALPGCAPADRAVSASPLTTGRLSQSRFEPNVLAWTNPGFDLGYDPATGPAGPPVGAPENWSAVPANFTAAQRGWQDYSYGINVNATGSSPTFPVGLVRVWSLSWDRTEAVKGRYDWAEADKDIGRALRAGHKVLATVGSTPGWGGPGCPPYYGCAVPDLAAWSRYVRAVAQRYRGKLHALSCWNEQTSALYWSGTPQQYAALLKVCYQAAKSVSPALLVLSGSGTGSRDQYRDYVRWFEDVLKAGAGAYMDALEWHYYPNRPEDISALLGQELRPLMTRYGLASKPLWITEGNAFKKESEPGADDLRGASLLSRWLLHFALSGASNFCVFQLDQASDTQVSMSGPATVRAWSQVMQWTLGARFVRSAHTGDLWAVQIERRGRPAYLIWSGGDGQPSGKVVALPASWNVRQVMDLNGAVNAVGQQLGVGRYPRLLY